MELEPFLIERWYQRFEFNAELMLSSSDCESWTVADLLALEEDAAARLHGLRLGYTEVPGSTELRRAVAARTETCAPDDVLVLAAAEEGIFVACHVLLGPGDHAVVETPCYGSALTLARSTGAAVTTWQRRFEDGWAHDLDALERAIRPETRLLYVNSPHNPTGTQMPRDVFDAVVGLAREHRLVLFSDEVYRGLEHDPATRLPAVCDVLDRGLSLGAVSKTLGLPGLRLGWLVTRDGGVRERLTDLKLYTTICSSAPSEVLAALALRHHDRLLARNRRLVARNLPLVSSFLDEHRQRWAWVEPTAGPIGFPRRSDTDDTEPLCERLATEHGVLLLPGSVYGEPRHVRVGFGRADLPIALARLCDAEADAPHDTV
jgi:aspartate/methionine/tyrosine aminotransferase